MGESSSESNMPWIDWYDALPHVFFPDDFDSKRFAMVRFIPLTLLVFGCLAVTSSAQPSRTKEDIKFEKQLAPPKGLRVFFAPHSLMWYVLRFRRQVTFA
jgi:hypothetical protein